MTQLLAYAEASRRPWIDWAGDEWPTRDARSKPQTRLACRAPRLASRLKISRDTVLSVLGGKDEEG